MGFTQRIQSTILQYLLFLICIFFLGEVVAGENIPPINMSKLKSGERILLVGRIADFPPFYYFNGPTNFPGIDEEILQEVTKRVGITQVQYIDYRNFRELNQALLAGKIDLIVNDYWDIPIHTAIALITIPYYKKDGIAFIYQKSEYNFKTLSDLQGHPVGTFIEETNIVKWVRRNIILKNNIKEYQSRVDLMKALKNKEIDAAFVYYTFYYYLFGQHPVNNIFNVVKIESYNSVFGMRKQDTELNQNLNNALQSMWTDGSLNKIKKKYLGPIGIEPDRTLTVR